MVVLTAGFSMTSADVPFPKQFNSAARTIFKRLFRVFAHLYYSHFEKFVELKVEAHLNSCFKHFAYFIDEFDLIDKKELAPLSDLTTKMFDKDAARRSAGHGGGGSGSAGGEGSS